MHLATLPPEVNSERMYSGPGPASLISAATAWDGLAAGLCDTAAQYASLSAKLAERCREPAATAMIRAAASHIEWLNAAAAHAGQAASQARAAARAYEAALAAMVPPAEIEANRALRTSLIAANRLGQTGPAIADTEAAYERMWAQDADAWYDYAAASAAASVLTPFTSPPAFAAPTAGGWALTAAPDVVAAGSEVMSSIPGALTALSLSTVSTLNALLSPVTPSLSKLSSLSAPSGSAISNLNSLNKAAALLSILPKPKRAGRAWLTARLGCSASIGALSVPPAWTRTTAPAPGAVKPQWVWSHKPIRLVHAGAPPIWPSCS